MSSTRALVAGTLVIALSAVPLYVLRGRQAPESNAVDVGSVGPSPWTEAAGPAPEAAPAPATEAKAPPAAVAAPGFDLVRVAPDGMAVVAGRAEPGASVTIRGDGATLAEVTADNAGEFVAVFRAEPAAEPRALTLEAALPGGAVVTSEEVVVLLPETQPPAPEAGAAPAVAVAPGLSAAVPQAPAAIGGEGPGAAIVVAVRDPAAPSSPAAVPSAAGVAAASPNLAPPMPGAPLAPERTDAAPVPELAAAAIVRPGSVEVMPMARPPSGDVNLASVSYTGEGGVTLEGGGTAGAQLRAYVDDAFITEGSVDGAGRWSIVLAGLEAGVYRLRIDQLAPDGRVASRVETPFQRDYPQAPRPRMPAPLGPTVAVTVQPGHNLWTLAREHYGQGTRYTQIFTANADQIRDPDLIYPGQILAIPEEPTAAN